MNLLNLWKGEFKINAEVFFLPPPKYSNTKGHTRSSLERHFRLILTVQLQREK